ncbi:hypothetical protein [Streptosporangium sp. NPDC048865]|uniref:hypothetical protein n=1 Tax=Streptosporangium sp. NPDC048865 TaxID=3155766 RepID=UPI00344593FA
MNDHHEIERLRRELNASLTRQVNLGKGMDIAADIIRGALRAGHHHGPAAGMRVLYERAADVEDVDLTGGLPHPDHADDLGPEWEAAYEPGNVSNYRIGYLATEDLAKAAAETWLRSQATDLGRLKWDQYGQLVEVDDAGFETDTGLLVRRRVQAPQLAHAAVSG